MSYVVSEIYYLFVKQNFAESEMLIKSEWAITISELLLREIVGLGRECSLVSNSDDSILNLKLQ